VAPTPWIHGAQRHVSRRTASKKVNKLYWPSRKRSPKRLIVLLEPKSGGARPKKIFSGALRRIGALPPLLNSFRRHCSNHDFWWIAEGAWPLGRRWLRISNAAVANVRLSHQFHQQTSPTAAGVHDEQCARELHRLTGYMLCADLCLNANRAELTNVEALFEKICGACP